MVDIAFALSATALSSDNNFRKMTSLVDDIINSYNPSATRYSIIKFGNTPVVELDFGGVTDLVELRETLRQITKNQQGADLARALRKARQLFQTAAASRPNTKKVLVVAMDKVSDSDEMAVKVAARSLAREGVRVIAVTFGKEADLQEIEKTTLNKNNVIQTDDDDSSEDIAAEVIDRANNGKKKDCVNSWCLGKNEMFEVNQFGWKHRLVDGMGGSRTMSKMSTGTPTSCRTVTFAVSSPTIVCEKELCLECSG